FSIGLCPRFGLCPKDLWAKGRTGGLAPNIYFKSLTARHSLASHQAAKPERRVLRSRSEERSEARTKSAQKPERRALRSRSEERSEAGAKSAQMTFCARPVTLAWPQKSESPTWTQSVPPAI